MTTTTTENTVVFSFKGGHALINGMSAQEWLATFGFQGFTEAFCVQVAATYKRTGAAVSQIVAGTRGTR